MEKRITINPNVPFFSHFSKIIRSIFNDYSAEKVEKTVKVSNIGKDSGMYRFVVEWQSEEQCGIDVFKILENA